MSHEYGDDIDEYSDYNEAGEDEEEAEEELEYEDEERQPTQEEIEYLELRQRLKESIRKKMKRKEVGGSHLNSQEKKRKLPFNDFGSFFGPSQPVISSRVIQESKSLLENQQLASRLLNSRNNSKKPVSSSSSRPKDGPSISDRRPKVVNELKRKVEKLKDTRDYSFLFSDDADVPGPSKEPSSLSLRASSPAKQKQPLGGDGRYGSHLNSKPGSSGTHMHSKPGISGNQLPPRPGPSMRQLPPRPGPSGRQLPPKHGSSGSQLHSRAGSLGGQLNTSTGSSGTQLHARNGSTGSQMQSRQVSLNSQLHHRQGPSGTQMHSRPVSSGSQMNARQGTSGSQMNPRSSSSGSQVQSRTVPFANGQIRTKQVLPTNRQMHSKLTTHNSTSIRRPVSLQTDRKTGLSGSKSLSNGVQRSISSKPQQSVMRQNVEQRKVSHEPSRSQLVSKQSAVLSKHQQMNRPLKQAPSRGTIDDRRPKKKPVKMSEDDLALSMIRKMFKTDRYAGREVDDDDSDMEANFDDIMREESRSARIARKEDEEQLRLIEEEERQERMRKMAKKRKLSH